MQHLREQVFVLHALVSLHALHDGCVDCVRTVLHDLGLLSLRGFLFDGRYRQIKPELVALEVFVQVEPVVQDAVRPLVLTHFRSLRLLGGALSSINHHGIFIGLGRDLSGSCARSSSDQNFEFVAT